MSHPIVLIHGMWCTGQNFARMREMLEARGYVCHAPNLPGHEPGQEDPNVGERSLREYLSFLEDYIHAQHFQVPPILIGHSMGGLLAQQLAARIAPFALVLLTPAAPAGINGLTVASTLSFLRTTSRWGFWRRPHKPSFARAVKSGFNGLPESRHAELYAGLVPESGRALFEIGFWALDAARASQVDAKAVKCPVYVVSCGQDRLTPATVVRKVAALYPHAALRHYPDRGHWVIDDEDTERMTDDLANWMQAYEQREVQLQRAAERRRA